MIKALSANIAKKTRSNHGITLLLAALNNVSRWQQGYGLKKISFLLAITVSCCILFWPKSVMSETNMVNHSYVTLLMLSNSICFVHGMGYVPETLLWRVFFTPLFGWGLPLYFILTITRVI